MIDKEIFEKAQKKAIENGFIKFPKDFEFDLEFRNSNYEVTNFYAKNNPLINSIIFSHDFAKAFFKYNNFGWKHHLQRMVLYENPLEYLEIFL